MVTEFGHHGIKTLDYGRNGRLRANVTIMCRNDEFSWLFTKRLSTTRLLKVQRMERKDILRRIWLFSANKIKSSESFSKQPTQLIVELNSSLRHIIVTQVWQETHAWNISNFSR